MTSQPETTVVGRTLTEAEMQAKIDAMLSPDGAWKQLIAAQKNLLTVVGRNVHVEPRSKVLKPGIRLAYFGDSAPPEAVAKLLLDGAIGLRAEFANGPENTMQFFEGAYFANMAYNEKLEELVDCMDSHSELSKLADPAYHSQDAQKMAELLHATQERKCEALWRCANEIEWFVANNREVIGEADCATITSDLARYRENLGKFLDVVWEARDYLNPREATRHMPSTEIAAHIAASAAAR